MLSGTFFRRSWLGSALLLALTTLRLSAATVPQGFTESLVATGLTAPTTMQFAPDGRLFVLEQGGQVRVIQNGILLPTPFISLAVDTAGERGLLGIAFDPAFASKPWVYLYYTTPSPGAHNRVVRVNAGGDVASGPVQTILELEDLSTIAIHNGGAMAFGPTDGMLYIAVGENGDRPLAQRLDSRFGKILRIDPESGAPAAGNPTSFPGIAGSTAGVYKAIWAVGLRNPYNFTFNTTGSGPALLINDVGEWRWEEINAGLAGANYGWPATEDGPVEPGETQVPGITYPIYSYIHEHGCAVVGSAVYQPATATFPVQYHNRYFFADYCGRNTNPVGWIALIDPAAPPPTTQRVPTLFAEGTVSPVDVRVGDDGALYYLTRPAGSPGAVYRLQYGSGAPGITSQPADQTVVAGQQATFSVAANGSSLTYQWQRNRVDITGATGATYAFAAQAGDNLALFRVRVTNSGGTLTSNEALLKVSSNQAPVATITLPTAGVTYGGGQTITYAGTSIDAEDGTPSAAAHSWRVDFHHGTHVHPFLPDTSGTKGSTFVVPTAGHTETNVYYRITLTVTDSDGATHSVFRDVLPRVVQLTLNTVPQGQQLLLDSQPVTAPLVIPSVEGVQRTIGAPAQTVGGISYVFSNWSDGGAASHAILTPAVATTYTASFSAGGGPTTGVTLTPSVPKPQPAGATVVWTATPQGGTAPMHYRFWIQPWGQSWTVVQDWSAAATFAWTPTADGGYNVGVQARRSTSADTEASVLVDYVVSTGGSGGGGPVTSVSVTPSVLKPQLAGTTVVWTATPQGGSAPVHFRFWIQPWGQSWTVVQDWSAAATFAWTPTLAGGYNVGVQARGGASTATEAEVLVDYLVSTGSGGGGGGSLTNVTLTPSAQPAQSVGSVITWTAAPQGASTGVEYRFWVQPWSSGVWTVTRDWSATTTFGWTPTAAGGYNVAVEARQSATGASAQTAVGFDIKTP